MLNPKLVAFDLDGTLIAGNTWDLCHQAIGIDLRQNQQWYEDYRNGVINYQTWLDRIAEEYKKKNVTYNILCEIVSEFHLVEGVSDILSYLSRKDYAVAIVSGNMNVRVSTIAKHLAITHWRANVTVEFDHTGRLTRLVSFGSNGVGKAHLFSELCKSMALSPKEAIYVGDDENDVEIFNLTGRGILFQGVDPTLIQSATYQINSLIELVSLL